MKAIVAIVVAFSISLLHLKLAAQTKTEPCRVQASNYFGWKAELVSNRWVTLTFVPQLGGRLMQVNFNGHDYLFVNPKFRGKYISPKEANGRWINYGGDKIWPMPEGENDENHWVLQSSALDDGIAAFDIISTGSECSVRLTGQPDDNTGMRIVRSVTLGTQSPEIRFHAVMENVTAHPITWSIQSVSQYDLASHENAGDFNHDLWAFTPRHSASSFPDGFHVRYGLAQDPAFSVEGNLFRLHWTWFANEVWLDSPAGWLAVVDKSAKYGMIEGFHFDPKAEYPARTTVIFYQNGPTVAFDSAGNASITHADATETPYYMEAEVNSPMATLQPGQSYAFDTVWYPVALGAQPTDITSTGVVTAPLTATPEQGRLRLQGSFSVFAPGHLVADVFNQGGLNIASYQLVTVDPATAVELDASIPTDEHASRVALKLIGVHGEDRGTLSVAHLRPH